MSIAQAFPVCETMVDFMTTICARCGLPAESLHAVVYNVHGTYVTEKYCGRCWVILDGHPRGPYRRVDESFSDIEEPRPSEGPASS